MDSIVIKKAQVQVRVNSFVRSVYNWMAIGLGITGVVAYGVANSPGVTEIIFGSQLIFFGLIIAQLAMVYMISARIQRMQASTATMLFIVYSALNGATLSSIFLVYAQSAITSTFFICAATFTACSVYGWTTRRDLTTMGGFLTMGLIGIVIASVVNMFIQSSAVSTIVSYIGVLVFVGLTAYDTQDIKNMALSQPGDIDAGAVRKGAILGALKLYLDFINLFLMLLRIFGSGRDE
ncbi:MAG TPA: Bax inhibitor-1/YccA family protein [Desulfobacterales bacterium]|nr:Bax inhibitor-1/YccA family protein [Desulfobacterales bacterium]